MIPRLFPFDGNIALLFLSLSREEVPFLVVESPKEEVEIDEGEKEKKDREDEGDAKQERMASSVHEKRRGDQAQRGSEEEKKRKEADRPHRDVDERRSPPLVDELEAKEREIEGKRKRSQDEGSEPRNIVAPV